MKVHINSVGQNLLHVESNKGGVEVVNGIRAMDGRCMSFSSLQLRSY